MYERLDLCECKTPVESHGGFNWQEGSGTNHYPHRIIERRPL